MSLFYSVSCLPSSSRFEGSVSDVLLSSRKLRSSVWKITVVLAVKNFFLSSFTSLNLSEREMYIIPSVQILNEPRCK